MADIADAENKTVWQSPSCSGLKFGVELELEYPGLYEGIEVYGRDEDGYETEEIVDIERPLLPEGWDTRVEESVQGCEVVFSKPLAIAESVAAINRLFDDIERQGVTLRKTPRGSSHFHINVQDLTWPQMRVFALTCAWLEPYLIYLAGKGRIGNLFAKSYKECPAGWRGVVESIQIGAMRVNNLDSHYMAINFGAMSEHGSVEFRMPPSATSRHDVLGWLSRFYQLGQEGRQSRTVDAQSPPVCLRTLELEIPGEGTKARLKRIAQQQVAEIEWNIKNISKPPEMVKKVKIIDWHEAPPPPIMSPMQQIPPLTTSLSEIYNSYISTSIHD